MVELTKLQQYVKAFGTFISTFTYMFEGKEYIVEKYDLKGSIKAYNILTAEGADVDPELAIKISTKIIKEEEQWVK